MARLAALAVLRWVARFGACGVSARHPRGFPDGVGWAAAARARL